jgi:hypothetical protein
MASIAGRADLRAARREKRRCFTSLPRSDGRPGDPALPGLLERSPWNATSPNIALSVEQMLKIEM